MKLYKTILHTNVNGVNINVDINYNSLTKKEYKKLDLKFKISSYVPGFELKKHDFIIEKNYFEKVIKK